MVCVQAISKTDCVLKLYLNMASRRLASAAAFVT
jgi:hypothetical protein